MKISTVPVWGFPPEKLIGWPADMRPRQIMAADRVTTRPIVVYGDGDIDAFQHYASSNVLSDGTLPRAILMVSADPAPFSQGWAWFDATVREGDWPHLRSLLQCEQAVTMPELVETLPGWSLDEIEFSATTINLAALSIPREAKSHLATCTTCRQAFDDALERRLALRHLLLREARQIAQPVSPTPWLQVPLDDLALQPNAPSRTTPTEEPLLQGFASRMHEALEVVLRGLLQVGMLPAAARVRRTTPALLGGNVRLDAAMALVRSGEEVVLTRPHRDLSFAWIAEAQSIQISSLHGTQQEPVESFSLVFTRRGEEVWRRASRGGGVTIALSKIDDLLSAGVDEITIVSDM